MKKKNKVRFLDIAIIAIIAFVAFQFINPIDANAPVSITEEKVEIVENENYQTLENDQVRASVLMYHHVSPMPDPKDKIRYNLTVTPEELEEHVKYLKENAYSFLTLSELNLLIKQRKVPEKVAVLTFDDGYDDNYIYAKPILDKYEVSGTFFIISNFIGKAEYVTADQVKELSVNHEIGSHSYSHPALVRLSDYHLERELKKSKDELEEIIAKTVVSFCYPAGKYDDKTVQKLTEYGYEIAVTTQPSNGTIDSKNLLLMPRYRISPARSLETLIR